MSTRQRTSSFSTSSPGSSSLSTSSAGRAGQKPRAAHAKKALSVVPSPVEVKDPVRTGRRVLLLNATFEPLTALPLRRAVVLVLLGKAEIVHDDPAGLTVRSLDTAVAVPSVIRLSTFVRVPYIGRIPLTRSGLMHRDRYRCAYCGGRAETIDHVLPRSKGGKHTWQNCVASCAKCNHRKADKLLSELGWQLHIVPTAPRGSHWRLLAGVSDTDPLWLPYLGEPAA